MLSVMQSDLPELPKQKVMKIGDHVRFRSDLATLRRQMRCGPYGDMLDSGVGAYDLIEEMVDWAGDSATVTDVWNLYEEDDKRTYFSIDGSGCFWSNTMLEGGEEYDRVERV